MSSGLSEGFSFSCIKNKYFKVLCSFAAVKIFLYRWQETKQACLLASLFDKSIRVLCRKPMSSYEHSAFERVFFICFSVLQKRNHKSRQHRRRNSCGARTQRSRKNTEQAFFADCLLGSVHKDITEARKRYRSPRSGKSTSLSYTPVAPRITPSTTKATSILAGVIFVTSISICPITHMSPPTKNALRKSAKNISPSDFRNYFVPIFNNYSFRKSNPPGKSSESVCTSYSPLPSPRIILKSPPQNSSIT